MEENRKVILEDVLPGYLPEFDHSERDVKIADLLGISEEDFEIIVNVAEMFFISESSLSMCIKKSLELLQKNNNMNSKGHALAVYGISLQVRERVQIARVTSERGGDAILAHQSITMLKAMKTAAEYDISEYFNQRLMARFVIDKKKPMSKTDQAIQEAERAINELLRKKEKE